MDSTATLKNKFILLLILALAAGFILFLPNVNSKQNILTQDINKTKANADRNNVNCDNDGKSELSLIINNDKTKIAPDACLFVGCSDFSF